MILLQENELVTKIYTMDLQPYSSRWEYLGRLQIVLRGDRVAYLNNTDGFTWNEFYKGNNFVIHLFSLETFEKLFTLMPTASLPWYLDVAVAADGLNGQIVVASPDSLHMYTNNGEC